MPAKLIGSLIEAAEFRRYLWQRKLFDIFAGNVFIGEGFKGKVFFSRDVNPSLGCVSRHNGGTAGALLKPLGDDSALRALSSLRGLRGAPEVPPLCRETQSLGQQMLNATVGINGLILPYAF